MESLNNQSAAELLYSLKGVDKEILKQFEMLEELKGMAVSVTVSTDKEAIQTSSSKDKIGGIVARIVDLENEIESKTFWLSERRNTAKDIIFSLNSECYQNILYDYFICDLSLGKIAFERDARYNTVKNQLKQGIREFEKIYDNKNEQKVQHIAFESI